MQQTADLSHITLAVLAGGKGRRMGIPKAHLSIGGKPILAHVLETLQWPGPTLLVTAPEREHPPGWELFDREAVDPVEQGPLGGVLTALENSQTAQIVIMTLDMPNIRLSHLAWMVDRLNPQSEFLGLMSRRLYQGAEQVEPFPFACRAAAREIIARRLAAGNFAVHRLSELAEFAANSIPSDWPTEVWVNINSPEDFQAYVASIKSG
ncbi:MAG: molybdenum cofactor guanylyltransferase [Planctomycetota bacterium]|nr:molybdenum cofactor guanylyltransferase [Planctomycetota bacterium]